MKKQVYKVIYQEKSYNIKDRTAVIVADSLKEAKKEFKDTHKNITILSIEATGQYRIEDITNKFPHSNYQIDTPLDYLEESIERYKKTYNLDFDPDFQRGYVWTEKQQREYVEYILRGGVSNNVIYLNCPNWQGNGEVGQMVIVDGKQRLTAVLKFVRNELEVFDGYKYNDLFGLWNVGIKFNINGLNSRLDVLRWYKGLNTGGTVHTDEELAKVDELIKQEEMK